MSPNRDSGRSIFWPVLVFCAAWIALLVGVGIGRHGTHTTTTVRTVTVSASCPALLHHDQQLQRDLTAMGEGLAIARHDWEQGFDYAMNRFAAVPRTPPTCGETR